MRAVSEGQRRWTLPAQTELVGLIEDGGISGGGSNDSESGLAGADVGRRRVDLGFVRAVACTGLPAAVVR